MRAFIHIGLHKTGTTFVQYLANKNHESLLDAGVYYDHVEGYPAHHTAAWALLRGDVGKFAAMAQRAQARAARILLISSEDLESLIFKPDLAAELVDAIKSMGVTEVTFVVYVRRQDRLFWSHYSELSKHVFVDPWQMLSDALRLGYVFINDPKPGCSATPYWYFCFDHGKHIAAFATSLASLPAAPPRVRIMSFDDFVDFPGDELFDYLGVRDKLKIFPTPLETNRSLAMEEVSRRYAEQIALTLGGGQAAPSLKGQAQARMYVDEATRELISKALVADFGNFQHLFAFNKIESAPGGQD